MINRAQMEAELKLTYPKKTSQITHDRRIYNIIQLKSAIEKSINEKKLSYNSLESLISFLNCSKLIFSKILAIFPPYKYKKTAPNIRTQFAWYHLNL